MINVNQFSVSSIFPLRKTVDKVIRWFLISDVRNRVGVLLNYSLAVSGAQNCFFNKFTTRESQEADSD